MIFLLAALGLGLTGGCAYADGPDVAVTYTPSDERLTTERVWSLDPGELNPHRQRWALKREVKIQGLEATELSKGTSAKSAEYGVRFKGLISTAEGMIRGSGPWYPELSRIPCEDDAQQRFGTEAGSRVAVDEAGKIWGQVLREEGVRLAFQMRQIKAARPHWALNRAVQVYSEWLRSVEIQWRNRAHAAARSAEWKSYSVAGLLENCRKKTDLPTWREMMEPVPAVKLEQEIKPRLRAPARRWDGAFSVRADAVVSDVRVAGQMLFDSGAPRSLVSSEWMTGQGFPPNRVEIAGAPPEHFTFTAGPGGSGLARRIQVDGLRLSGENFSFSEFLLSELDLFGPPNDAATCCDAVLGADFLARNVVEFVPGAPGRAARPTRAGPSHFIRVWPREGFVPPASVIPDPVWVEVYFSKDRVPTSVCDPVSIRWQTGSDVAWKGALPASMLQRNKNKPVALNCGGVDVVDGLLPADVSRGSGDSKTVPGIGMPVLGRGPMIFDLPHGRIWFSRSVLSQPILRNSSGLRAVFNDAGGERALVVTHLVQGSSAAKLAARLPKDQALGIGARIQAMDGLAVDEMDEWDVTQILAGARGSSVKLDWVQGRSKIRSAVLELHVDGLPSK